MRSIRLEFLVLGTALSLAACGEVVVEEGNNNPDPTLMAVTPTDGPLGGGTQATVTGGELTDAAVVVVGPFVADNIQVSDAGTVTFVTPPGLVAGVPQDILVFNENGFTKLPGAFTYNPVPEISAADVNHGNVGGGTQLMIAGSGFMTSNANVEVSIGGVAATDVNVVDDQTVTVKTGVAPPAMAFQSVDITLSSDNGDAVFEQAFTYTRSGLLVAEKGRNGTGRGLFYVDPMTGVATQIGEVEVTPTRMSASPDGWIYEVGNVRGQSLSKYLVKMDPLTGQAQAIDLLRDPTKSVKRMRSLAFVGGMLYGYNRDGYFSAIDPATANFTELGPQDTTYNSAACVERRDASSVYYAGSFDQSLDSVNLATGAIAPGPLLGGTSSQKCHGMALFNGTYYVLDLDRGNGDVTYLEKLEPVTGLRTQIALMPSHVTGLTATPAGY